MITKELASEIASGWSACGMRDKDGNWCDTALYQFSSWGGRIFSEDHRERCLGAIKQALHWMYANRQSILSDENDRADEAPNRMGDWADLVRLELFIINAEVQPEP